MKVFFRNVLSSCLGTLLALGLLVLIVVVVAKSFLAPRSHNQKGILHLKLSGQVADYQNTSIDLQNLSLSGANYSYWNLKSKISDAAKNENIEGLFLEFENANLSQQMISEISPLLLDFRSSGKKIYSYSSYFSQNEYLLSTFTDSIFLNPNGGVSLKGYGVYSPFFNELLDEYEIDINVFYAGKYKSSTEPYRLDSFSSDNEDQLREYVNKLHEILVEAISKNRNIIDAKAREIIASHRIYDSQYMKEHRVVDALQYRDEVMVYLEDRYENSELVSFEQYKVGKVTKDERTAIVFASGEISWDMGSSANITPSIYQEIFKEIRENDKIETVILRLNSPGGNGYASDLIHREVELTRAEGKKVYASLGTYATSGAYYIASACDSIFATTNTLTGSIGVYLMIPTVSGFVNNYLNVTVDSVQSNPNAIGYTPLLGLSEVQRKGLKEQTDRLYSLFLAKVAEGRSMTLEQVEKIAQGRIWNGDLANEIGLVDEIRGLDELISKVSSSTPAHVFPKQTASLPMQILENGVNKFAINENYEIKLFKSKVADFQKLIENPAPLMRLPYTMNVTNQ